MCGYVEGIGLVEVGFVQVQYQCVVVWCEYWLQYVDDFVVYVVVVFQYYFGFCIIWFVEVDVQQFFFVFLGGKGIMVVIFGLGDGVQFELVVVVCLCEYWFVLVFGLCVCDWYVLDVDCIWFFGVFVVGDFVGYFFGGGLVVCIVYDFDFVVGFFWCWCFGVVFWVFQWCVGDQCYLVFVFVDDG